MFWNSISKEGREVTHRSRVLLGFHFLAFRATTSFYTCIRMVIFTVCKIENLFVLALMQKIFKIILGNFFSGLRGRPSHKCTSKICLIESLELALEKFLIFSIFSENL